MSHEINLEKYEIRTDLIDEVIENKKIDNINSNVENIDNIKIQNIHLDKKSSKLINKKEGNYTTIIFDDITDYDNKEKVKNIFINELKKIIDNLNIKDKKALIIGLGNEKSTPDSLGPLSVNNIIVTNHLYMLDELDDGFIPVSAFIPNVTGVTGIETSDLIKNVVNSVKPSFLIVIDSLASSSIDRVNKTIQITDTGIHPGSGVGNSRKEISYETIGIPIIAIGVPTVVDATIIVSDTINYMEKHYVFNKKFQNDPMSKLTISSSVNYLKNEINVSLEDKKELLGLLGNFNKEEIKTLIFEVLNPIGYNLMVTPKEIDFVIEKLSDIIGNGINRALHKKIENI
ncbi:MAG: GPR endopeptidase [Lactobacillales bacterium]|nr:GPR endopeptidase [Lactobacillales bacterium]